MATTALVIEDDASVAELLRSVLEAEGFTVLVEPDGEWGLRAFSEREPDVVITDVLLPKIQGFELVPKLRRLQGGQHTPVFVVSGVFRSSTYREKLTSDAEISGYFDKPIDTEAFLAAMRETLGDKYPNVDQPRTVSRSSLTRGGPQVAPRFDSVLNGGKGSIAEIPFARLFGRIVQARSTGALMLRRASIKKIVYFQEGVPQFVKSNLIDECLGRVMVRERLITQDECDASLSLKRRQPDLRQGELLMQMGCISRSNRDFALELQMQTKFFEPFGWTDGRFQLNESVDYDGPRVIMAMSPSSLIYEGVTRFTTHSRILHDVRRYGEVALVATKDPTFAYQAKQLDPRCGTLLALLDGKLDFATVVDRCAMEDHDAARLLYALVCAGLVLFKQPESVSDDDLVALSTGEIDAVAELAKIDPRLPAMAMKPPSPLTPVASAAAEGPPPEMPAFPESDHEAATQPPQRSVAERLAERQTDRPPIALSSPLLDDEVSEDSSEATEFAGTPLSEETVSEASESDEATEYAIPPAATSHGLELLAKSVLGDDEVEEGEAVETDAFSDEEEHALHADAFVVESQDVERPASVLPRSSSFVPAEETPQLSSELREQIRSRLEAKVAQAASKLPQGNTKPNKPLPKVPSRPNPQIDLGGERKLLQENLQKDIDRISQEDLYKRLGLEPSARSTDIELAWRRLGSKVHPDRLSLTSGHAGLRLLAEQRYLLLERAHEILRDSASRERYDRAAGHIPGPRRAAPFAADAQFEAGCLAAEEQRYRDAVAYFAAAVELDPQEGIYLAYWAWAQVEADPEDAECRDQALETLDKAAQLAGHDPEVHRFTGEVLRRAGMREPALLAFQRAVEQNPEDEQAQERLRELQPPKQKTGLLSRFGL